MLIDELTTGPLAAEIASFIASGDDGAIAGILNRKDIPAYGWVSTAELNTWCALNNAEYLNIVTLAGNNQSPFYSAANAILNCLSGSVGDNAINLASAPVMALLNSWPFVDATGTTKADLLSRGAKLISRAEQLGINVTAQDVAHALRG